MGVESNVINVGEDNLTDQSSSVHFKLTFVHVQGLASGMFERFLLAVTSQAITEGNYFWWHTFLSILSGKTVTLQVDKSTASRTHFWVHFLTTVTLRVTNRYRFGHRKSANHPYTKSSGIASLDPSGTPFISLAIIKPTQYVKPFHHPIGTITPREP